MTCVLTGTKQISLWDIVRARRHTKELKYHLEENQLDDTFWYWYVTPRSRYLASMRYMAFWYSRGLWSKTLLVEVCVETHFVNVLNYFIDIGFSISFNWWCQNKIHLREYMMFLVGRKSNVLYIPHTVKFISIGPTCVHDHNDLWNCNMHSGTALD